MPDEELIVTTATYTGPERRQTENEWRRHVEERLLIGAETMKRTEEKVDHNTKVTETLAQDTRQMVEMFKAAQAAFQFLDALAKWLKPIGVIAGVITAFWALFTTVKGGGSHKP